MLLLGIIIGASLMGAVWYGFTIFVVHPRTERIAATVNQIYTMLKEEKDYPIGENSMERPQSQD